MSPEKNGPKIKTRVTGSVSLGGGFKYFLFYSAGRKGWEGKKKYIFFLFSHLPGEMIQFD